MAKKQKLPAGQRWITLHGGTHAETGEHTGRHVLIDGKGNIVGGAVPKAWQGHSFADIKSGITKEIGDTYHNYDHEELKGLHKDFKDSHAAMQKELASDVHGMASWLRDSDAESDKESSLIRRIREIGRIHVPKSHEDWERVPTGVKKAIGSQNKNDMGMDEMADALGMSESELLDALQQESTYQYKKISDYHDKAKQQMGSDYTNRLRDIETMGKHVKAMDAALRRHKNGAVKREEDQKAADGAHKIWGAFAGQAEKQIPGSKEAHEKGGINGLLDHISANNPKTYENLKKNMADKVANSGDSITPAQKKANDLLQAHKPAKKKAEPKPKRQVEGPVSKPVKPSQEAPAAAKEEPKADENHEKNIKSAIQGPKDTKAVLQSHKVRKEVGADKENYPHAYTVNDGDAPSVDGGKTSGKYLFTKNKLSTDQIGKHGVVPLDSNHRAELAMDRMKKDSNGSPVMALGNKEGNAGALIHPSAKKPGKWQVTGFNQHGYSDDSQHDTVEDAMRHAIKSGYKHHNPGLFDKMSQTDAFKQGNAATLDRQRNDLIGKDSADKLAQRQQQEQPPAQEAPQDQKPAAGTSKKNPLDELHNDAQDYMKGKGDVNDILKKHDKLIQRMAQKTAADRGGNHEPDDLAQHGRIAAAKTLEALKNGTQKPKDGTNLGAHIARRIKQGMSEGARQLNENTLSRGGTKLAALINSERQKHAQEHGAEPTEDQLFDRVKDHPDFKGTQFTKPGTKENLEDRAKFDEVQKAAKGQKSSATLDQNVQGKDGDNAGTVGGNMADQKGSAEDQAIENENMSEAEQKKAQQREQIMGALKEFGLSDSQAHAVIHRFGVGHGDDSGVVKDWKDMADRMSKQFGKEVKPDTAKRHYYDGLKKLHAHIGDERMTGLLQKSLIDSGDMGAYMLVKSLYEMMLLDLMKSHDMTESADFDRVLSRVVIAESMPDLLKSLAPSEYLGDHKTWADGSVSAKIERYQLRR